MITMRKDKEKDTKIIEKIKSMAMDFALRIPQQLEFENGENTVLTIESIAGFFNMLVDEFHGLQNLSENESLVYYKETQVGKVFIEAYLDPEKEWNPEFPFNKIELLLREYSPIANSFIKAMDYKRFLETPYWKAIAEYKKQEAENKCQLCNKMGVLHTHHRTYSIHGNELHNLKDLIVLCDNCHAKFHNKLGKGRGDMNENGRI